MPTTELTPDVAGSTVRDRVLEAALKLFAQQGYDATGVSQIIASAGTTKGGFYHHFASKEDLLYEVYGDLITRQLASMDVILALDNPPAVTLRALILDLVRTTAAGIERAKIFLRELNRLGDERTDEYRRLRRRYHDSVKDLIGAAQHAGDFSSVASAETVTLTIFGVINQLPLWYRADGPQQPDEIANELADLILAALQVRP
jgi:AcrR family transcriptional regulator